MWGEGGAQYCCADGASRIVKWNANDARKSFLYEGDCDCYLSSIKSILKTHRHLPVEQITKPVANPTATKKDPRKVAAGKALARKKKQAREAKPKMDGQTDGTSMFDTFRNVSMLVGSALVLYHGYQAYNVAFGKKVETPRPPSPPPVREKENSILME